MGIRQRAVLDVVRDALVEAFVEVLESSVDLLITASGEVAEIEFENNIVVVGVEVIQVLHYC